MEEKTKIKETVLSNGIRGVVVPLKGLKSVTIEVFVKIGSKYERANEFGLSHFLEHMAFKGTIKRPTPIHINNEIDSKGASYNAGTSQEMTSYYVTTVRENLSWAAELLADILFNSTFDGIEVEKERGVIAEEIRMYQDNPMMGLSGDFIKFFYEGSSGCWNISGEVEDVVGVKRVDIVNYRNKYFNPKNIVVVIAGDTKESDLKLIHSYFENWHNQNASKLPLVKVNINPKKELIKKKEIEQGHFCVGVPAISWKDGRKYAFKLLDIILAGNTSSRLYTKIREERALAYYVMPVSDLFEEAGFLGIQSGVKQERLSEALELSIEEMLSIGDSLKEEELNRAKEYLNGKTKLMMDRSDFWSTFVGQKILLEGKLEKIEDELEKYKKVGLKEVKNLAKELFLKDSFRSVIMTR